MIHLKNATLSAIAAFQVLALSPVLADQVLPGPYSSWSNAQISEAASLLKNGSNANCSIYVQRAQAGGMRATYEAAACIEAYYVLHLPTDYPGLDAIKAAANQNYQMAKQLGSDIPEFLKS